MPVKRAQRVNGIEPTELAPDTLAAALSEWVARWQTSSAEQIQRVNDHLRGAKVVQFLSGDQPIFITNADPVLAEMPRFL